MNIYACLCLDYAIYSLIMQDNCIKVDIIIGFIVNSINQKTLKRVAPPPMVD